MKGQSSTDSPIPMPGAIGMFNDLTLDRSTTISVRLRDRLRVPDLE
jgi:hypothetical protein